jgi:hypothetical protein
MVANFEYTGLEHLFRVMIIGNKTTTALEAKTLAQSSFNTLLQAGRLSGTAHQTQKLNWAAFSTHGPMHARVSVDEVKNGFYQDLYKLQGARVVPFLSTFRRSCGSLTRVLFPRSLRDSEGGPLTRCASVKTVITESQILS